jgi:hypothetical protein
MYAKRVQHLTFAGGLDAVSYRAFSLLAKLSGYPQPFERLQKVTWSNCDLRMLGLLPLPLHQVSALTVSFAPQLVVLKDIPTLFPALCALELHSSGAGAPSSLLLQSVSRLQGLTDLRLTKYVRHDRADPTSAFLYTPDEFEMLPHTEQQRYLAFFRQQHCLQLQGPYDVLIGLLKQLAGDVKWSVQKLDFTVHLQKIPRLS